MLQEKKLDEEDEALIKSIFNVSVELDNSLCLFLWYLIYSFFLLKISFSLCLWSKFFLQGSNQYVRRIDDEEWDDDKDEIEKDNVKVWCCLKS